MTQASDEALRELEFELVRRRYAEFLSDELTGELRERLSGFARAVAAVRAYPLSNADTPLAAPEAERGGGL